MELDYSPDGNYFVAGTLDQRARLYYSVNRTLKCTYNPGFFPHALKFFPTNDKFAYGYDSSDLKIVSSDNCVLIRSLNTQHVKIYGIDFSYDGTLMLTCGDDQKFRVWNISGIDLSTTVPPVIGGGFTTGNVAWTCKFSSDNYILIGHSDGTIKLYGPTFTNSLIRTYTQSASGKPLSTEFFYCENHTKIIVGSDNARAYWYNGTSTATTIPLT
jgi:WD40 repeat protein